jgi:glycosyltransferase involved in cell wall biosynthesis
MFSIIIPLYNKEKEISPTLNSVLNQTFTNFEVIVIDDGSTDNSYSIVQSFLDSRLVLLRKCNGGVSSARNLGIETAKFEYIAFLDADDLWDRMFLEEMSKLIDTYPDCGIYGSLYKYKIEDNLIMPKFPSFRAKGEMICIDNYFKFSYKAPIVTSSSSVIRKNIFSQVGVFNERLSYGEDLEMWIRINLKYTLAISLKYMTIYNLGANNRACNSFPIFDNSIVSLLKDNVCCNNYSGAIRYFNKIKLDFLSQFLHSDNKVDFLKVQKDLSVYNFKSLVFKLLTFQVLRLLIKK